MITDRYAWALQTAAALRAGDIGHVDLTDIAGELEQIARGDARELRSRVRHILEYLLKLQLATMPSFEENRRVWRSSILEHRAEIESLLEESPGLRLRLNSLATNMPSWQ